MKLAPIIGLEIHVQLKTKSKMFCSCDNSGEDKPPNTTICPICLGHPGVLPMANQQAIEWSIMAALALKCKIPLQFKFDRKSYFYPDLPKNYQISQYDMPIGIKGYLIVEILKKRHRINITRLHLEEDAAKNFHSADGKFTLVDFNRSGTPLMEIVSEPDIRSPQEAKIFLQELRLLMRYLEISEADMEKGHLRCDANISLTDQQGEVIDKKLLKPKTEIKNLNSFKAVERALEYEIKRQTELWQKACPPDKLSTRGWNENKGITEEQRIKEEAHDYRYFPEPDLPPWNLKIGAENRIDVEKIKRELPELPWKKRERFRKEYELSLEEAKILTNDKDLANYTEWVFAELKSWLMSVDETEGTEEEIWQKNRKKITKIVSNWLINRLSRFLYNDGLSISQCKITPENFAEFITIIYQGKIKSTIAQKLLEKMYQTGKDPSVILDEEELKSIEDETQLEKIIDKVLKENLNQIKQYKKGKQTIIQFFIGQVMRETKGRANPQVVFEILKNKLKKL